MDRERHTYQTQQGLVVHKAGIHFPDRHWGPSSTRQPGTCGGLGNTAQARGMGQAPTRTASFQSPWERAGQDVGTAGEAAWSAGLGVTQPQVRILSMILVCGTWREWLPLLRPGCLTGRAWLG